MTLPTAYLPPLEYFRLLPEAEIEVCEHFPKRTLRNRALLLHPHSPAFTDIHLLSIPVAKANSKQFTRDVRITYQLNWQQQHWNTIVSLYRHAPYFLYFEDYLRPFYERHYEFLVDFNTELNATLLSLLRHECPTTLHRSPTFTDIHPHSLTFTYTNEWQGPIHFTWENECSVLPYLFDH